MPWRQSESYPFTREGIEENAPSAGGVYVLFDQQRFVYVGETDNIQRSLARHLDGDNAWISAWAPPLFSYELHPAPTRVARQAALIRELKPACNTSWGQNLFRQVG
jgi:predicted GIY-YIG superfamily endonuclease